MDAVRLALTVGAGTGGAVALVLAGRRQWATEHDATERRITELYIQAVGQLGAEKAAVRHGGLYALERVAQDNPAHRQTVVDVICAYLRTPYEPPIDTTKVVRRLGIQRRPVRNANARHTPHQTPGTTPAEEGRRQEREVRLTAQRILARHLRPADADIFWNSIDLNLDGAVLQEFNLARCSVRAAHFSEAEFHGTTSFSSTTFASVAAFDHATFHDSTWFDQARFEGNAHFFLSHFFRYAGFGAAVFFRYASFTGAELNKSAPFDSRVLHREMVSSPPWVRIDVPEAISAREWPAGYAVEPTNGSPTDGDKGKWGRLINLNRQNRTPIQK